MAKRDVVGQLSRVPLFSGCSRKDLQTVARVVKDIDHAEGTVIAREGEPGVGLFVIVEGTADVTIGGKPGNQRVFTRAAAENKNSH